MKKASGNTNIFVSKHYDPQILCESLNIRLKKAYITKEDQNLLKQMINLKEYKITIIVEEI